MNKKNILLSATAIIIAGVVGYVWFIQDSYQWSSLEDKANFTSASWNKITLSRLDGFTPQLAISEHKTEPCKTPADKNTYLRNEGGLCQTGYWLEVTEEQATKKIDSIDKLKETFGPVDNEAEAAAFVSIITSDLKINPNDIVEGYTATIRDGYLVKVVRNNTFGCGNHKPTNIIYKVLPSGDVWPVALEKPRFRFGSKICID